MKKIEFGDFQTPKVLSDKVIELLAKKGIEPKSVIEPTCGVGNFLLSSLNYFVETENFVGVEINKEYLKVLESKIRDCELRANVKLIEGDFFKIDWSKIIQPLNSPILIAGNLPWVTNSSMGTIEGNNIPQKSNFLELNGLDAITGKSNFDISEWMYIAILKWLQEKQGYIAMLSKTSVARKIIQYGINNNINLGNSKIYKIDAKKYFNASVDACLFYSEININETDYTCSVFNNLNKTQPDKSLGYRNGKLIANINLYDKLNHLKTNKKINWRSGLKHDCSKVMELTKKQKNLFTNKLGKTIELEETYLYPLLKSSDVSKGKEKTNRYVIVTQKRIGEETSNIKYEAPKTWEYLKSYQEMFDKRKSSIYNNKPPFSIFGIGKYSFAPYKVCISGLYKGLKFSKVGSYKDKPVMIDDTCYFLACMNGEEASFYAEILNSPTAKKFFNSYLFNDSKRSITATILKKLDIYKLALELNKGEKAEEFLSNNQYLGYDFSQFELELS